MLADAGVTEEQMKDLNWNPEDGGTYEKVIAHLTVDKNGKRGDEAGFDKNNVAVYGLGLNGPAAATGQTQWSFLTNTTGWTHTDKNPWGTHYNYDDPKFQETIAWWTGLVDKGYMPKLETTVGASMTDNFGAGKSAINANGSWMIGQYTGYKGVEVGIAPTPMGPDGKRASMFNGLADSIWAGTKNQAASVKWVEYLASAECQDVVGLQGGCLPRASAPRPSKPPRPSRPRASTSRAFTEHVKDKTTFLYPITDNAAKVKGIMEPAMDAVVSGKAPASSLTEANEQVNALFK